MTSVNISLAGVPFSVIDMHNSTKDFCKDYLTKEAPLFSVSITQNDIEKMRECDRNTALSEGRAPTDHTDRYLEPLALAHLVLDKLMDYEVIMIHGVAVAIGGKAYLFTAKSGTGKTTHCKLWLDNIPNCHILNGDKPLIKFCDDGIFVCGSPWMGKEKYGINETLPLAGICILGRDNHNHIETKTLNECFEFLLGQCHIPSGGKNVVSVLRLISRFSSVNLYQLGCNMDSEAAFVSYNAMVK